MRSKTLPGWMSPLAMRSQVFGEEPPDGSGAAVEVDEGHEQVHAAEGGFVGDADEADVAAGPAGADGLQHRFLGADGLDDRVGAEAACEVLDAGDALVAASFDDVGGAEVEGQLLAVGVAAHGDDPLGAELAGGEDAEEADGAVADDGDGLAGADLGGDGGEPAGAEDVGGGEVVGHEVGGGDLGGGDEGAVGEGDAGVLGLGADGAHERAVDAGALVAGLAELAGAVRRPEGADDELAGLDGGDGAADLLDDAAVLVTHRASRPRSPRCRGRATGRTRRCRSPTGG